MRNVISDKYIKENVPVVDENKRYWFIRTYSGALFNNYYEGGYVGLGINNIPSKLIKPYSQENMTPLKELYLYLNANTEYKDGAATQAAKQLISFDHDINIGDTIVIPNKHSQMLAIGTVVGDVYSTGKIARFSVGDEIHEYPQRRRKVKWEKKIYKKDLQGSLSGLIGSHHGLTNADKYSEVIDGTLLSLYIKDEQAYFTLKINQDDDINAFVLNRFLTSLTYFYNEFCKENGIDPNENLSIKIKLQSKGKVALKALAVAGLIGVSGLVTLSDNMEVKAGYKNGSFNVEGHSDGFLNSLSNFLDKNQERKMQMMIFKDSLDQLHAMRYTDSLKHVNDSNDLKAVNDSTDKANEVGEQKKSKQ